MVLLVEKRYRSILLSIIKSEIEPRITIHSGPVEGVYVDTKSTWFYSSYSHSFGVFDKL